MSSEEVKYGDLQSRWKKLTEGILDDVSEKWWNILKEKYSESTRKYHTCAHLQKMFHHMDLHVNDIQDSTAMSYAIFFHDFVYDVRSQENEEHSVKFFQDFAEDSGLNQNAELITKVEDLILASKTHCTEEHKSEGIYGKNDVHYFLDFDVSILGSEPSEYKEYASQICEEYNYLPPSKYNFLRSKVLQLFLQVPNIYATKAFRDKYEHQARLNIENEIQWLSNASNA